MDFITTKEAAERWGISQRRVAVLCEQGRIIGVKRTGKTWLLPFDAIKPEDGRTEAEKSQRKINIELGEYYEAKKRMHSYSPALQQCIEEACRYCIENLEADSQHVSQPIMLLGKIQSGKTRAFTGLMALAFDNLFDMVIILTKNSTALVKQTYKRMRQEFRKEISDNEVEVFDIMNVLRDGLTDYELEKKLVIISKKEHRNLDRISTFITTYTLDQRKNCLIIDDEADTAGIGFSKVKDTDDEFYLRKVAQKVNDLRGTLSGCVFVQVTATPYALYLQPEIESDITKPIKPKRTVLVPPGEGYIGGDYYFLDSKDDKHPARFIFEPVSDEENELVSDQKRKNKKSKIDDRRTFKIENILTDQTHLEVFKKGLMNFIVGGCVLRMVNKNTHYSYVIHTATQKSSHFSLEAIAREFFKQIKSPEMDTQVIETMLRHSYDDIRNSYVEYGFEMPSFKEVSEAFYQAVQKDYISFTPVNSDNVMNAILDEDTGELKLRSPLSIFVGGQVLDRGVTIPRMIGFYYGRNPITMQQDTVMQHSRMFGYRDKDLLSVTRFYTTRRIFENMTLIAEMDKALREDIENKDTQDGIYFLQKYVGRRRIDSGEQIRDVIIPCAPSKIALSEIVLIKPHKRILPIGFTPIPKSYASRISNDINKRLLQIKGKFIESEVTQVKVEDLIRIINLAYSILEPDEESLRFVTAEHFLATLQYLAGDKSEVLLYIRRNARISKLKNNNTAYQDSPDTGYELNMLCDLAVDTPALMLIHQDGTANGWNGSEFWWPVIIPQAEAKTTIYALPEADGKIQEDEEA